MTVGGRALTGLWRSFGALGFTLAAYAQSPAATVPPKVLSLNDALQIGQRESPAISYSDAAIDEARGHVDFAQSRNFPTLEASSTGYYTEIFAAYPLYASGRIAAQKRVAEIGQEQAQYVRDQRALEVRKRIIEEYVGLLHLKAALAEASSYAKFYTEIESFLHQAERFNSLSAEASLAARIEVKHFKAQRMRAESDYQVARSTLARELGTENFEIGELDREFELAKSSSRLSAESGAIFDAAEKRSPLIAGLQLDDDRAVMQRQIDDAPFSPGLSLLAGYGYGLKGARVAGPYPPSYLGSGFAGGLTLRVPIFDGFATGANAKILAGRKQQSKDALAQARLDLHREVEDRLARFHRSELELESLGEISDLSERSFRLVRNGYRTGGATLDRAFTTLRNMQELQVSRIENMRDFLVNRSILRELTGL